MQKKQKETEKVNSLKRDSLVGSKLLFTAMILFVYLVGRFIPLYGIDTSEMISSAQTENILMQTIGGDLYRYSLFSLGISPYMIASIFVQMVVACKNTQERTLISPRRTNQIMVSIMFVMALVQAVLHVKDLVFLTTGLPMLIKQIAAVSQMITGSFVILWLSNRNKKYGIGGQTALILVNIIDGIVSTAGDKPFGKILIPGLISLIVMIIMVIMENAQKCIPVQRVSIHNIYADKNYIAIKMNPIGVMPVMFASAVFMLPQLIVELLCRIFPQSSGLAFTQENLTLQHPLGILVYILILYLLTMVFAIIFISPSNIAEQLLKTGDSILDLHAGKQTKKYLQRSVYRISFFSATIMALCIGIPLFLQQNGTVDESLVMLPTSIMMLTGIWCTLYQEILAVKSFDSYKPFI